ncbi:MAG: tetratricopeptide repeat protein [Chloroflexi bacterium]|uniref:Tetratricopeptide repeat protein n=1 Tax=Candidatus Chlorohelix allophototropha TaxID=3003348 RepID=A0A8T7M9I5_9CHLR|nr:tetratricopeptide repeat protein [Chloroflexota bacterium]
MSQHEPQKHFFISYNKADKGWAEWVAWLLEQDGYSLTIQAWDSLPGTNFAVYMHNAIISSQRIIAILSDNYLNSLYTLPEWAAFFTDDPTGEKRLIIPVLVAECDSKKLGLLKSLSRIKLLGKEEAQAREELLEEIRKTLKGTGRPDTAPRFPGMVQTANDSSPAPRYPGTFPPIWNLTHQRNAFFTGREDLLDALESAQTNAITQAVAGLGGVGKTQTAVEYAYRNKERFDLVWWVNAEFATSLRSDLADLAFKLGLATQGATEQAEAIALALHYLRTCPTHWLLVLDNVEEPADIRPYLPNGGNGQTLITSRYNGDWGKSIKPLFAQIWGQSQSVQFLEKRTERSEAAFEELAQELGGLPLALEQAAAYMNAKSKSGESYLELFKKRRMELLKRSNAPEDYHNDTVATTWEISFKALGEANPAGAELLELCAWLGVAEIPFSLFLENAEELPERLEATAGDELDWDDAIGAIKRYSLAEVSGEGLTLHRLVGLALRTAQGTDTARLEQAAKLLWAAYPDVEFETWEDCGRLLEVGMAVAGYAEERGAALAAASYLYNQIALYLQNARADYRQALPLFQRALAISEKMLGSEHPTVAIRLINMGGLLREMGEYASALPLFQRALAIDEKALGAEHPDIATNLNHLGSLLQNMGEYASALPLYQRAIEIGEKTQLLRQEGLEAFEEWRLKADKSEY